MKQRRLSLALAGAASVAFLVGTSVAAPPPPAPAQEGQTYVYRVPAPLGQKAQDLLARGFDVLEQRDGDDLFVLGSKDVHTKLAAAGFTGTVEQVMAPSTFAPTTKGHGVNETYYGGYRTIKAHYAHLDQVALRYARLATVVDYGDSWRRTQGAGGHDLKAICITRKSPGDCKLTPNVRKPRLFVSAQIHAREITTGDMAWRWIDHLTQGYGKDSEVTSLLDTTEVWVVPIANPDGVQIVQSGGDTPKLQRKNANYTNGPKECPTSEQDPYAQIGIDVNRNFDAQWGDNGTSSDPCSQVYRGPKADSEVETRALEKFFRALYPDTRGPGLNDPADPKTRGMVITMHAALNVVLLPWGYTTTPSPNDGPLRAMAKDMAQLAGPDWRYGQPGELLYTAGGSIDDWVYGELGVPHYTWEIGNWEGTCVGFTPEYACQDGHWAKVKPMLTYAARKAANPYGG
ncbi:M14 family zinc carboxypeptidase [Lentzea sp. BCCO 10_0856]|uniref:M14 family zinc carboxypeptidase n=1 Tax=Lentzea miocenica TaxID=3095431 RepID=A0ABU4STG3_9PSEU|nr:M14 family zinc carboxypeptidase [Lentzea sp. BCCO 10_0856]MDX8029166.1 M14 family zinc carboxypeptidase [Lentzea sp. BCCO 10_0856]